jgi:drug/metabolite transporter (DMT)-like permease
VSAAALLSPAAAVAGRGAAVERAPFATGRAGGPLRDGFLLVAPGLIWSASFLFIAEALQAIGPYGLTFARILVGFGLLGLLPAARRPVARTDWARVALLGVIWLAFPLTMFPLAEQRVSSALTGMLNGANPLFTAVVAAAMTRRLPSRRVGAGLAVGLLGVALVALPSLDEGRSSVTGVLLILAALTGYGFAINVTQPLQQRYGALPVLWRAQAVALVLTAPLGLPELVAARWTAPALLSLLLLGALGTGVAYVLLAIAAGRLGTTRASATTFLIPPVALLLGVAVRGEQVALLSVVGGAVCVAGAWVMRRAQTLAPRSALPAVGFPDHPPGPSNTLHNAS